MGLYNRFCKRFFAAVIIRLTAQSDSRAHSVETFHSRSEMIASSVRSKRKNKVNFISSKSLPICEAKTA